MRTVKAGRVPGMIVELELNGTGEYTVYDVMKLASEEIGRKKGLTTPAFPVSKDEYSEGGRTKVDVPQLNGKVLADKQGDRWTNIAWDTTVKDGDIVLVVPKIQGNQFTVTVQKIPGMTETYCLYSPGEPGASPEAGTVADALKVSGIPAGSYQIWVNGKFASLTTALSEGDKITVKTAVKPEDKETEEDEETAEEVAEEQEETKEEEKTYSNKVRDKAAKLREEAKKLEEKAKALDEYATILEKESEAIAKLEELGVEVDDLDE